MCSLDKARRENRLVREQLRTEPWTSVGRRNDCANHSAMQHQLKNDGCIMTLEHGAMKNQKFWDYKWSPHRILFFFCFFFNTSTRRLLWTFRMSSALRTSIKTNNSGQAGLKIGYTTEDLTLQSCAECNVVSWTKTIISSLPLINPAVKMGNKHTVMKKLPLKIPTLLADRISTAHSIKWWRENKISYATSMNMGFIWEVWQTPITY